MQHEAQSGAGVGRPRGDRKVRTVLPVIAIVVLVLVGSAAAFAAAGATGTSGGRDSPTDPAGADRGRGDRTGVGPGISVADALDSDSKDELLVKGWLVVDQDGTVRLCDALAESDPPQCAGASVRVEGLDLGSLEGLTSKGGVTWSQQQVKLLGRLVDGVLKVSEAQTA